MDKNIAPRDRLQDLDHFPTSLQMFAWKLRDIAYSYSIAHEDTQGDEEKRERLADLGLTYFEFIDEMASRLEEAGIRLDCPDWRTRIEGIEKTEDKPEPFPLIEMAAAIMRFEELSPRSFLTAHDKARLIADFYWQQLEKSGTSVAAKRP